jgi:hypothetical protein
LDIFLWSKNLEVYPGILPFFLTVSQFPMFASPQTLDGMSEEDL